MKLRYSTAKGIPVFLLVQKKSLNTSTLHNMSTDTMNKSRYRICLESVASNKILLTNKKALLTIKQWTQHHLQRSFRDHASSSLFYGGCNSAQLPWLCFFPAQGCWKYCSLMRGCELWCALTAWPIPLTASLRLDFRPVEGELSTCPWEPLPFLLGAGKLPWRSATERADSR